jgi:hypothetical protein
MQIVDAIATKRDFPVDTFAYKVKEVRDEIHKNEREKLRQIHSKEAIDAEIEAIRKTPTMRIPFTTGLFMPDSVTKQLNQNKQKVSEECLINNIIKPYKWYEIDHVIIDPEDHKTIVNSNWKELWALRIGFVVLIGAVISCIVYFAIFYSKKSESADYEREKSNIVNGIKFGITACMSLIMFLCNKTTNARDSIVTNHLKTAVDVVRRVEKERSDLSDMTASVRENMAAGRAALAASAKPRGGLERTVVRGFVDRKASVQNVRAIAKSGDFFVHKTGGFSSGYGVTHRPSGTTIYQSHSLGATKAAMDGVAKSGSKILSRIEGGDLRAAKALQRYRRGLSSADFYNKAHRKYG